MRDRFSAVDNVGGAAAAAGMFAAFLPWSRWLQANSEITVNGFRSTFFGDLFFLAAAATLGLILSRRGVLELRPPSAIYAPAFTAAAGAAALSVALQLIAGLVSGHRLSWGLLLAIFSAGGMAWSAWQRAGHPGPALNSDATVPELIRDYDRR